MELAAALGDVQGWNLFTVHSQQQARAPGVAEVFALLDNGETMKLINVIKATIAT